MFDEIKNLILSKTAKDTYVVFAGNIISFFFGIFFAILAARAIEPSGWGIFSAYGGVMVILFAVSEMGLSSGLFRFVSRLWSKGETKEAKKISDIIFTMRLLTSVIFSFLMIMFGVFVSNTPILVYLTALGLIGSLLTDFQISLFQVKRMWFISSLLLVSTNFFRLAGLIFTRNFWILDLTALFAVFFLTPFLTFLASLIFERPSVSFQKNFFVIVRKISKFSIWMGINRSVGSISSRVDSILLLQLAGAYEAGIVGAARQLGNAVMILLASFATVIAPRLASYEGTHLKKYYKKVAFLSVLLGVGVLAGVLFVDPIISLFGPKYAASAGVLKWLLIGLVPFALSNPSVNALIYAFHKPKIIALLSVVQLPLIIAGNILLVPRIGIYGPVVIIGLWNLSTLVVSYFKSKWELSHTA